jgi:hypothetical protein
MVEVPGRGQQHRIATLGQGHHHDKIGMVAAGGDGHLRRVGPAAIQRAEVSGIGLPQRCIAHDWAIGGGTRIPRRVGEALQHAGRWRMRRHGLAHVQQYSPLAGIVGAPDLDLRDGWTAGIE